MPADIQWNELSQKGEKPAARSGHSLSWIGGINYLLFGGIEDTKGGRPKPSSDIYTMKLGPNDVNWTKETPNSDDNPLARAQHIALTTPKNDKVFVFGGHHSPSARLNDTWYFIVKEMAWMRVGKDPDNITN